MHMRHNEIDSDQNKDIRIVHQNLIKLGREELSPDYLILL